MSHAVDAHDHGDHGHGDHGHSPFLAHHFDDAEQQFDSGKLGMWLFLVTEVLFFSGMFCAYALYRARNPEVWTFSSQFLNATLGAVNTGVLLFSSLSMAWGVRCAQLRQRTGLVISLAVTLGCASLFLGVKAVEYTHKWELGLLPAGEYVSQYMVSEHHTGVSSWLYVLSSIPALCVIGFGVWYAMTIVQGKKRISEIAGPLLVTALCYFVGVFLGIGIESASEAADVGHTAAHGEEHVGGEHGDESNHGAGEQAAQIEDSASRSGSIPRGLMTAVAAEAIVPDANLEAVDQPGGAGLFFSIYYCMTGVHAIHILAGMAVMVWLLVRSTKDQFNEEYFGPIDYFGLYWHLVDLIWIYLFPLLYLIK